MFKTLLNRISKKMSPFYPTPSFWSLLTIVSAFGFYIYSGESFALQEQDKVAEIATLTTDVSKLAKNGCYITGCASALIGAVWSVAQQSLKVFGVAAAVTLLAFKAPSFFTSALLI